MKKCLHLKKTKPHWRRKPVKVVTWRERMNAARRNRPPMVAGPALAIAAMGLVNVMEVDRAFSRRDARTRKLVED